MSAPGHLTQCNDANGNVCYWSSTGEYFVYPSGHRYYPRSQTWVSPQEHRQQNATIDPRTTIQPAQPHGLPPGPELSSNDFPSPSAPRNYTVSRERTESFSSGSSFSYSPQGHYSSQPLHSSATQTHVVPSNEGGRGEPQGYGSPQMAALEAQIRNTTLSGGRNQPTAGAHNPAAQSRTVPQRRDWQPRHNAPSSSQATEAGPSTQRQSRPIHREITSTPGEYEELDPRYKRRKNSWFEKGRVFKMHWSQPSDENATEITPTIEPLPKKYERQLPREFVRDRRFGQYIYSKIRWFIVVRPGANKCLCVPIVTYQGKGVKKVVTKSDHAIVHTSKEPPKPDPDEQAKRGEKPMRTSIRVRVDDKGDRLMPMSRIDYGRVYTVEQNVKAMAFGWVHDDSLKDLSYDFVNVFMGEDGFRAWDEARRERFGERDDDEDDDDEDKDEKQMRGESTNRARPVERANKTDEGHKGRESGRSFSTISASNHLPAANPMRANVQPRSRFTSTSQAYPAGPPTVAGAQTIPQAQPAPVTGADRRLLLSRQALQSRSQTRGDVSSDASGSEDDGDEPENHDEESNDEGGEQQAEDESSGSEGDDGSEEEEEEDDDEREGE